MQLALGILLYFVIQIDCRVPVVNNVTKDIKIITVISDPFVKRDANGTLGGFIIDLLEQIVPFVPMTFSIKVEPKNLYGIEKNGSWSGMIGALISEEFDLAAADITMTDQREKVVDFTIPYMPNQIRVLYNPKDNGNYSYLVGKDTSNEELLRTSTNPVIQEMWDDIVTNNGFSSSRTKAIERVQKGGYAFIGDTASLMPILPVNTTLRFTRHILKSNWMAFAVRKGSRLGHDISVAIAGIQANGGMQQLVDKYRLTIPD